MINVRHAQIKTKQTKLYVIFNVQAITKLSREREPTLNSKTKNHIYFSIRFGVSGAAEEGTRAHG